MGAPRKIINATLDRSFTEKKATVWKDVPLSLVTAVDSSVVLTGAHGLSFELHTKREFSADSLLAQDTLPDLSSGGPFTFDLDGDQMNQTIAEGKDDRTLYGVVYSFYTVTGEVTGVELDILAIFQFKFERHNASPTGTPPTPPTNYLTKSVADALYAPIGPSGTGGTIITATDGFKYLKVVDGTGAHYFKESLGVSEGPSGAVGTIVLDSANFPFLKVTSGSDDYFIAALTDIGESGGASDSIVLGSDTFTYYKVVSGGNPYYFPEVSGVTESGGASGEIVFDSVTGFPYLKITQSATDYYFATLDSIS